MPWRFRANHKSAPMSKSNGRSVAAFSGSHVAAMALLFMVFFLGVGDNIMISPLLPLMAADFGRKSGEIGGLIGPAYAAGAALAALVTGPASDRYGRKRFLLYAAVLFSASLFSVALIKGVWGLVAVRFFAGLAAGTFSTCSIAYVGDYFPYERRGTAMSVVQSGYFAAFVFGIPAASWLSERRSWRAGMIAFGLISAAVFFLMLALLVEDRKFQRGSANFRASLGAILVKRDAAAAVAAAFFVSAGFMGFIYYLGSWLSARFGLKPSQIGSTFIVIGLASLAGGLVAGPVADRLGKRNVSIASTLVLAIALLFIPGIESRTALLIYFLVASFAFAFRQGPLHALATQLVSQAERGALVAARNLASQVGIAASYAVSGHLYDSIGYGAVGMASSLATLLAAIAISMMREPSETSR